MDIYTDEIFGPVLVRAAGRHLRRGDRADQREPVRQRHRDLHLQRRGGPARSSAGHGRHDRRQRADPGADGVTTPSAAGRTRCSATSTCTAPRASASTPRPRSSPAAGRRSPPTRRPASTSRRPGSGPRRAPRRDRTAPSPSTSERSGYGGQQNSARVFSASTSQLRRASAAASASAAFFSLPAARAVAASFSRFAMLVRSWRDGRLGPGPRLRVGAGPLGLLGGADGVVDLLAAGSRRRRGRRAARGRRPPTARARERSAARAALEVGDRQQRLGLGERAPASSPGSRPGRRRARRTPRSGRRRTRPGRPGTAPRARPRRRGGRGRRPSTRSSGRGRRLAVSPHSFEVESSSAFLMSFSLRCRGLAALLVELGEVHPAALVEGGAGVAEPLPQRVVDLALQPGRRLPLVEQRRAAGRRSASSRWTSASVSASATIRSLVAAAALAGLRPGGLGRPCARCSTSASSGVQPGRAGRRGRRPRCASVTASRRWSTRRVGVLRRRRRRRATRCSSRATWPASSSNLRPK